MSIKDDYIEKYGQKALEIYHKSHKPSSLQPLKETYYPDQIKKRPSRKNLKHSSSSKIHSKTHNQSNIFKQANNSNNNGFVHTFNNKKSQLVLNYGHECSPTAKQRHDDRRSLDKKCLIKVQKRLQQILQTGKQAKDLIRGAIECLDIILIDNQFSRFFKLIKQLFQVVFKQMKESRKRQKQLQQKYQILQKEVHSAQKKSRSNSKIKIKQLQQQLKTYQEKQSVLLNAMEQFKISSLKPYQQHHPSKRYSDFTHSSRPLVINQQDLAKKTNININSDHKSFRVSINEQNITSKNSFCQQNQQSQNSKHGPT